MLIQNQHFSPFFEKCVQVKLCKNDDSAHYDIKNQVFRINALWSHYSILGSAAVAQFGRVGRLGVTDRVKTIS
jgi:hypothetical protein